MKQLDQFDSEFSQILEDNRSGSVKVLHNFIIWLKRLAESGLGLELLIEHIGEKLKQVCETHQNLVVVDSFREAFLLDSHQFLNTKEIVEWIVNYEQIWENTNKVLASLLMGEEEFGGKTILVHSNSHTIVEVLKYLKQKGYSFDVIQTESRPMFEGRQQSLDLLEHGIAVIFITDSSVAKIMPDVDMILLGADQFNQQGFLNKIGSYTIALAAKQLSKPVYVLTDSRKEVESFSESNQQPRQEVWPDSPDEINIVNHYFEVVPLSLVTRLITETGE